MEYAGFNPIIIESVGAGQTEVDISKIADITVVTFNPHTGDSIQTIKAGITEIGDIYLVNKSDLDGATQLFQALQDFIGTDEEEAVILKTSAKKNKGIKDVLVVGGGVIPEEDKKALEKAGVSGNFGPGTSLDIIIDHITKGVSKLRKL